MQINLDADKTTVYKDWSYGDCRLSFNSFTEDYSITVAYKGVTVSQHLGKKVPTNLGPTVKAMRKLAKSLYEERLL